MYVMPKSSRAKTFWSLARDRMCTGTHVFYCMCAARLQLPSCPFAAMMRLRKNVKLNDFRPVNGFAIVFDFHHHFKGAYFRPCMLTIANEREKFWGLWAEMHLNGQIGHNRPDRHMPRGVEKGAKANKKKTFWHSLSFITGETIEASREFKKYVWIAHIHTTHTEVFSNCSLNLKHRPGIKLATETGERSQMKSWMNVGKHTHTPPPPPPHKMRIDSANNEKGQQLSHLTIINTLA